MIGTEIRNGRHARQLLDFTDMHYGSKMPTDIDWFLDFDGGLFVWGEVKYGATEIPRGQELALERICDAAHRAGISSWIIVSTHATGCDETIDLASTVVTRYRYKGKWHHPRVAGITVREAVDRALEYERAEKEVPL